MESESSGMPVWSSSGAALPKADAEPSEVSDTSRLEAFSDGVFAVAITLLVLDLHVPSQEELDARKLDVLGFLATQWPTYLAYVASFLVVLVIWLNHHMLFKLIGRADRILIIYNGLLLMFVTLVPFSTSLLAEYVTTPSQTDKSVVASVYSGVFILISIAFNLLWRYAAKERRLLDAAAHQTHIDTINRSFRFGPLAYVIALALAIVNIPASLVLNIILAIYWALPHGQRSAKPSH